MTSLIKRNFQCPAGFQEGGLFPDQEFIPDLDDFEELIFIKAPVDFDFEVLNGQEISLSGKQEFKSIGEKKLFLDISSSSKHLENLCFLKKVDNGNECVPVGVRFKGQMDIYEKYSFPGAVIPVSHEKRVPCPTKLGKEFHPYGADDPVVCYKNKRRSKKIKDAGPEDQETTMSETISSKLDFKRKLIMKREKEELDGSDCNGRTEEHNTSPGTKKRKSKDGSTTDLRRKLIRKIKKEVLGTSDCNSSSPERNESPGTKKKKKKRKSRETLSLSEGGGDGDKSLMFLNQSGQGKLKKSKTNIKSEVNSDIEGVEVIRKLSGTSAAAALRQRSQNSEEHKTNSSKGNSGRMETKVKIKAEPESGSSSEY